MSEQTRKALDLLPSNAQVFTKEDFEALPPEQQEEAAQRVNAHDIDSRSGSFFNEVVTGGIIVSSLNSGVWWVARNLGDSHTAKTGFAVAVVSGLVALCAQGIKKIFDKDAKKHGEALLDLKEQNKQNGR